MFFNKFTGEIYPAPIVPYEEADINYCNLNNISSIVLSKSSDAGGKRKQNR